MTASLLNWTNARLDSLPAAPYLARLDDMADRLAREVQTGHLPFIDMAFTGDLLARLDAMRDYLGQFEHMLLLGIGGSALGPKALQKAFMPGQDQPGHAGPWLWIADNIDAYSMQAWLDRLPAEKTVVVAISKSGTTIETVSQYFLILDWLKKKLPAAWSDHLIMVTDPQEGYFRAETEKNGFQSLPVPPALGGRYSVISAVGLLPAAFMGVDYHALAKGAASVMGPLAQTPFGPQHLAGHPAWNLAVWARACMEAGKSELIFFSYVPLWASFGLWFAQLWAESLGKEGKGSLPVPAVGVTDQHSVNQMFLDGPRTKACLFLDSHALPGGPVFPADIPADYDYLRGKRFGDLLEAEALGTRMALVESDMPLVEITLGADGPYQAGQLISLFGAATILTGWLMDINPLDQPAVELGKRLAKARLGAAGLEREKQALAAFTSARGASQEF